MGGFDKGEAGVRRYTVITTKYYYGIALWNTKNRKLETVKITPAGRDLIDRVCKKRKCVGDIQIRILLSLCLHWSHQDYPNKTRRGNVIRDQSVPRKCFVDFKMASRRTK